MAVRKKATARSTGNGKRKPAKKMAAKTAKKSNANINVKEPLTKSGIIAGIMEITNSPRKDIVSTLEALNQIIGLHVRSRGPGKFVYPGLLKIVVVKKPARPARKGINPFTGEETMFKAKPAHKVVKVKALKKLKEMID